MPKNSAHLAGRKIEDLPTVAIVDIRTLRPRDELIGEIAAVTNYSITIAAGHRQLSVSLRLLRAYPYSALNVIVFQRTSPHAKLTNDGTVRGRM